MLSPAAEWPFVVTPALPAWLSVPPLLVLTGAFVLNRGRAWNLDTPSLSLCLAADAVALGGLDRAFPADADWPRTLWIPACLCAMCALAVLGAAMRRRLARQERSGAVHRSPSADTTTNGPGRVLGVPRSSVSGSDPSSEGGAP